ncbi:MAG: anthranilate phosphoribosyltransferase [Verrucomicrobia bacterium]|jgi:anthranilate phosphoribosyltransferase|nr:anthranilate phosphoribosyltransferase [Verrucomicrobiota bacterium]
MMALPELTQLLQEGKDLSEEACMAAATALTVPDRDPVEKKAFLGALHEKGETVEEVTAFAKVFRELASDPQLGDLAGDAIDVVGTGGTGSQGFNISSTAAFILAAGGVRVLKHGNRAVTSRSGSADFLSCIGIRMDTDPALLRAACEQLDFCFFFAPAFHPAFKEIIPVRKEMAAEGKRSVFNILGPLINPARPARQLLGVFQPGWVKPLADALDRLGLERGLAVCSQLPHGGHMDEITTAGPNRMAGFGEMRGIDKVFDGAEEGFSPTTPAELAGGDPEENAALLRATMRGEGRDGLTDTLLLNAGTGFLISRKVASIRDGAELAREILLGGALEKWLQRAEEFYRETEG